MRKTAVVVLGLVLAAPAFFLACKRERKTTIAVIPKGNTTIFWQSVHAGAAKAAIENGVEIIWNGPPSETDYTGQLQITDAMINRRVDAIVLAPIDRKAMVGVVERAARALRVHYGVQMKSQAGEEGICCLQKRTVWLLR